MKRIIAPFTAVVAALTCASCIQQEDKLTINADGTTKFTVNVQLDLGQMGQLAQGLGGGAGDGAGKDLADGRKIAVSIISGSDGVDVWESYSTKKDASGKVLVTLTGYAKDVTKLKLGSGMEGLGDGANQGKKKSKGGPPGVSDHLVSKTQGGKWLLGLDDLPVKAKEKTGAEQEAKKKLTDEEVEAKLAQERMQFQMGSAMMGQFLKDAKISRTLVVAGTIDDPGVFTADGANTGKLTMEFPRLFKAMGDMLNGNDPVLKETIRNGGSMDDALGNVDWSDPKKSGKLMESIFGKSGKPQMTITPGKPLFDYEASAAKAKSSQSAELKAMLKEVEEKKQDGAPEKKKAA